MKNKKIIKCENCGDELTKDEISNNWHFGKIWFCQTTCVIIWCVKQLLKSKGARK